MNNVDFIIIHGAPGTGKTTVAKIISEELKSPWIEFGTIPEFRYLTPDMPISMEDEQEIVFETLMATCKIYNKHGYKNFILTDFDFNDKKLLDVVEEFKDKNYLIINLFLSNDEIIKDRVLTRDNGNNFRDYESAIELNQRIINSPLLPNEYRIESSKPLEQVVADIYEIIKNYQKQNIEIQSGAGDYSDGKGEIKSGTK